MTMVGEKTAIARFLDEIAGVPVFEDATTVKRRSRDYFWYSPVLNAELAGKNADVIVQPRDEADVIRVARACARHRVPLTARGGGTGNYGQAVPLAGGAVLDLTAMTGVEWTKPGVLRCQPGLKMAEFDALTRPTGWELRMHP